MSREAIFIHSLWRSGSTWLFDRFRRAGDAYWCYQEPFHEALVQLNGDPDALLGFADETARSLRHPALTRPYFWEFHALRDALHGKFAPCMSYASFFDPSICPGLQDYVQTLIDAAPTTPVLQCCRSFGRVGYLQETHGGVHIHLWRDAVSQWFSYQISDYFDIVTLLVLQASNPPKLLLRLRQEIGLPTIESEDFATGYEQMHRVPLGWEQRYLVFYALWLYSLMQNHPLCTIDINLDRLSEDREYAETAATVLQQAGIEGVDLSSARSPVIFLDKSEREKFRRIEQRVEQLFLECGVSEEVLQQAAQQRERHRPRRRPTIAALRRNAQQAREMALRYADRLAETNRKF